MPQENLGRAAGDLIGYVLFFRDAPDAMRPSAHDLRTHLSSLLDTFENAAPARALEAAELDAARFALVAWIDETILLTNWPGQGDWIQDLLQTRLFATNKAGDEFFQRLESLPPNFNHAREVFFLCLVMGFEGKLAGEDARRQELIRQEYEKLRVSGIAIDSTTPRHLSEPAYDLAIEVDGGKGRSLIPVVGTWLLGTLVGFGVLFMTLWFLAGQVETPSGL